MADRSRSAQQQVNVLAQPTGAPLKLTPLNALHKKLGAKLVPFAGYEMPLQFSGIIAEHLHARSKAVLFDVSHMGQAILRGSEAAAALHGLVVGDIAALPAGKLRYTLLTNDRGGIIDDLIVINGGSYMVIVVNAARKDEDFAYLRDRMGARAELEVREDRPLLALQGPAAAKVMARFAPASRHLMFMTMENLTIGDFKCGVTRSGYTGEDGFEITVAADEAESLARLMLDEDEVLPAGLGARDTLRLEAGLCLYGQDIDAETTPVEAGLTWTISARRREEGGFPGDVVILRQMAEGPERKRVGIRFQGTAVPRAGAELRTDDGASVGNVTSGGYGPSVGGPIAMGYIASEHAKPGTPVTAVVRGKAVPGEIVKLPFVPHRYPT